MVQARLTGYSDRIDRGGQLRQTPDAYVASLRGANHGRKAGILMLDRLRPAMRKGGRRGVEGGRAKAARVREARGAEILAVLRALGGREFVKDVYGRFVERSATRGWPIVGYRRFLQILREMEAGRCPHCDSPGTFGRIALEVRSFGRYGVRTVVRIRTTENGRTDVTGPGVGERDVSFDSVSRMTHRPTHPGDTLVSAGDALVPT
jgi:hypothetical protein